MQSAEPRTIRDLTSLAYEDRHVKAHHALVHRSEEVQVGIYLLEPGGRIPAHRHSTSWDIALVIEGEIEARIGAGDQARVVRCPAHGMNLVPPGVVHEIVNPSASEPARFLLVQSPSRGFDFIRSDPPLSA
jgi:quercetin dioxygenase-like cupin family protein